MKILYQKSHLLLLLTIFCFYSCNDMIESSYKTKITNFAKYKNIIKIDSTYTYPGDSIYQIWINQYNCNLKNKSRSLSPIDDAFFNKQYIVKSTEATILYGGNYIFPGSILEGNSISNQDYKPIFVSNRNPITVSMTLTHNTPKHTSRSIEAPSYSKLSDYVVDMVKDGNFDQNQKFMFSYKRFSFYDEIKTAFGTNINTRKLFSSKSESSTQERDKIQKSAGMYVKFFQSSFTVNMDIAPLSNQPIKGNSEYEPVYVNSLTYGRLGIIVFETDETYEFAETCIKKEFDRIFYHKTTTLDEKEEKFFENTEFKVLIIGADSNDAVQTVKGYSHFLSLIYNSRFTETSYGVPITCSFSYANSHGLVETEFVNILHIEPLFVDFAHDNYSYDADINDYWHREYCDRTLHFYKDRQKKTPARPNPDIVFDISWHESKCQGHIDQDEDDCKEDRGRIIMRNIDYDTKLFVGSEYDIYNSDGPIPDSHEEIDWEDYSEIKNYNLESSPFYIILY